jgi:hypothetical protein
MGVDVIEKPEGDHNISVAPIACKWASFLRWQGLTTTGNLRITRRV